MLIIHAQYLFNVLCYLKIKNGNKTETAPTPLIKNRNIYNADCL